MVETDTDAATLVQRYFDAFNARDTEGCLSLLADDVVHDLAGMHGDGGREAGKTAFRAWLDRTTRCFEEKAVDLYVTASADGRHAEAEYTLLGVYLETEDGLPDAEGQNYSLPALAVFEIRDGRVVRLTDSHAPADLPDQSGV
jgi:steroid delta-isomerase-like uncharacterized protein